MGGNRREPYVTENKMKATEAEVFVYRRGAKTPVARSRSHAKIELAPGSYDIKIVAGNFRFRSIRTYRMFLWSISNSTQLPRYGITLEV